MSNENKALWGTDGSAPNPTLNSQWSVDHDGVHYPSGPTTPTIAPGHYRVQSSMRGPLLTPMEDVKDDLIPLGGSVAPSIIASIERFWGNEDRYRKYGMVYKRGVLLHGLPGGGKTAIIRLIANYVVEHGGITLVPPSVGKAKEGLRMIRSVEPNRRILVVLEDLDEIVDYEETQLLSLLDGEDQINGVVYLASTNHFDKLPSRIANRPSRFDECIEVPLPSLDVRLAYLRHSAQGQDESVLEEWAKDTDGLSIAHLKELVIGVLCLDADYASVLSRLKAMNSHDLA